MLKDLYFIKKEDYIIENWFNLVNQLNVMFLKIRGESVAGEEEIYNFFNHEKKIIEKNYLYFEELFDQINSHLETNPKLVIHFGTGDDRPYSALYYMWVITYGLILFDSKHIENKERGMISRWSVINSCKKINFILKYLNICEGIDDNMIKIIMYLTSINEIKTKKIIYKKDKLNKSDVHLKFNNLNVSIQDSIPLYLFKNEFIVRNSYTLGCSWLSYNESIKKSKKQYEINEINNSAIKKLCKRKIFISWDSWDKIKKLFLYDKKIKSKVVEYDFIFQIIEDSIIDYRNNNMLKEEDKKSIQRLYYFLIASRLYETGVSYTYMSYFFDFRGRIYPNYFFDALYMKFLRPFFYFKSDLNRDRVVNSLFYKNLNSLFKFKEINEYFSLVCKVEIGKLYKNKIEKDNISIHEFLELYDNRNEELKNIEEELYKINLVSAIEKNCYENLTIIKDSTASTFQHWGVELGYRDEYKERLNFDGLVWYDTYKVILNNFKEYGDYEWFIRKYWKKFIMKIGYNAGFENCISEVIEEIEEDINLTLNERDKIKEIGRVLYKYVKEKMFKEWYLRSMSEVLKNNNFTTDDCNINLLYFEKRTVYRKKDYKHVNLRWIVSAQDLKYTSDLKSTNTSKNANIIQCKDGHLARYIINKVCNVFTIHDSFGVNIYDLDLLMDEGNKYFNSYTDKNYYSIFIFL